MGAEYERNHAQGFHTAKQRKGKRHSAIDKEDEMGTTAASTSQDGVVSVTQPRFSGFSHASLPCRDLEQSKRFFTQVMGGELVHDIEGFAEVCIADVIIGLSEQSGGWTEPDAEYPHYAFLIDGENYWLMKEWLDKHGVPNHPWTRDYKTALMYFRDPSGNLFELYGDKGCEGIGSLPLGPRQGGPPIDFGGLVYQWDEGSGTAAQEDTPRPRFSGFGHASLAVRDLEQSKRFFTQVMGGELIHDVEGFAEVRIAGVIIGLSNRSGRWTAWDVEYPHYAFFIGAQDFLPMKAWLDRNGVKTHQPWTRDGKKGLMYFRDPSGNLFESYCPKDFKEAALFPRGVKQGGSYEIDFAGLNYEWQG
jgi:catechol 2,3-dioxygenase-like lactoylglutathione lyase family enzyme